MLLMPFVTTLKDSMSVAVLEGIEEMEGRVQVPL